MAPERGHQDERGGCGGVDAAAGPRSREVPHQRARLPYGPGADWIVGAIGYLVLCQKARPGTPAAEVAKVAVGGIEQAQLWVLAALFFSGVNWL